MHGHTNIKLLSILGRQPVAHSVKITLQFSSIFSMLRAANFPEVCPPNSTLFSQSSVQATLTAPVSRPYYLLTCTPHDVLLYTINFSFPSLLCLGFPSDLSLSSSPAKITEAFITFPTGSTCHDQIILHNITDLQYVLEVPSGLPCDTMWIGQ